MREVRLALLEADVNYKVAKDFTARITERAVGEDVMESLTPAQMVIKIVNEELTALMGGSEERLKMPAHPPAVIMMCGLQGAGKNDAQRKACENAEKPRQPSVARCRRYLPPGGNQAVTGRGRTGRRTRL